MKNKKSIMTFSALLILIFHLWANLSVGNTLENYIRYTAYIGVDIFFLLSGFSLASRPVESYWGFVWARFKSVYVKFIIFAIVAAVWSHWSLIKLVKVVTGIDFITRGGGSFLWFLPAIMIYYLVFPLFLKCHEKDAVKTSIGCLILWLLGGYLLFWLTGHKATFIAINRLPAFLAGFYMSKYATKLLSKDKVRLIWGLVLTVVGMPLLYLFGFRSKLMMPLPDMFYVVALIETVGVTLLVSLVPENRAIKLVGASTLEMYAIQMIFGYKLANGILKGTGNKLLTNILVIIMVTAIAVIVQNVYRKISEMLRRSTD